MLLCMTCSILSNKAAFAIHWFTIFNQAVSDVFRHILSVIAHKTHQLFRLFAFDEGLNRVLNTGVFYRFWCGLHLGSNGV
jgi:hypothetical protein